MTDRTDKTANAISRAVSAGRTRITLGTLAWFGGAIHTMRQPGCDFWDGIVWLYYVGRFIAHNFAMVN